MNSYIKSIFLIFITIAFVYSHSIGQTRMYDKVQQIINKATEGNLSGVAVYIKKHNKNEWIGVAGYQNKEHQVKLVKENIFATASIGKIYNAVAVMKLAEMGKLKLDDKINKYLSDEVVTKLSFGGLITIRHLLSNQSGLYNYEDDPNLNELYLSGKISLDTLSHLSVLKKFVFTHPTNVIPGTKYEYSSTNFMLLAMIMDAVTLHGHTDFIRNEILKKNGFENTFYREIPFSKLVSFYGEINNHQIENLTQKTIETTKWFMGDDGIFAPINEAAFFLTSLMNGQILSAESLIEMTTWNDMKNPDYGLGLMADKSFPYKYLIGHSGRGIGVTTDLYYFPKQKMTVGIFCNTGIRNTSKLKQEYLRMRSKIIQRIFLF